MAIAIFGCGCIGGMLAARLRLSGQPTMVFDRPETARVIRSEGIRYIDLDGETHVVADVLVPEIAADTGAAKTLILALKAHQIADALPGIVSLIDADTTVVTVQNGIPWWYFQCDKGLEAGTTIESVDPGGRIRQAIDPSQIVGCVAYPAATAPEAGHVRHVEGNRMPVGPADPAQRERAENISGIFAKAGFKSPVLDDIRGEIWLKAVGTASLNPLSALTRATFAELCGNPATRDLARVLMEEAAAVAGALGVELRVSIERRLEGAERVGHHRSSMLQDVERAERMEIDALIGSVVEIGERIGVPTPTLDHVLAMIRLLDETVCGGQ